jgi:hypothetical protein
MVKAVFIVKLGGLVFNYASVLIRSRFMYIKATLEMSPLMLLAFFLLKNSKEYRK